MLAQEERLEEFSEDAHPQDHDEGDPDYLSQDDLSDSEPIADDFEGLEEDEALPPVTADQALIDKLVAESRELLGGNDQAGAIELILQYQEAMEESTELLEIYLEASLQSEGPNWAQIRRFARTLTGEDAKNPIGNYALGLAYLNSRKPDTAKAMEHIGIALSSKRPPKGAAEAYRSLQIRKYGVFGVVLAFLLMIVPIKIVKKRRAARAAIKAELEKALGLGSTPEEKSEPKECLDDVEASREREEPTKPPPDNEVKLLPTILNEELSQPVEQVKPFAEEPEKSSVITAARDYSGSSPAKKSLAKPVKSFEETSEIDLAAVSRLDEVVKTKPVPRLPSLARLEKLWNDLSSKATSQPLPLYTNVAHSTIRESGESYPERPLPGARPGNLSKAPSPDLYGQPEFSPAEPEMDLNVDVSIDLSDDALQKDLLGKLKMLAIEDGELRTLLQQRNPDHIPHLIEYVMTRPEPLRLSFIAREAGYYRDPAVVDLLASLLYHSDERVCLAAIGGLQINGSTPAILHISRFLESDNPPMKEAAKNALSSFTPKRLFMAFSQLHSFPDEKVREAGIFVVSRMKGSEIPRLLCKMLGDPSTAVRHKALLAMAYQKNPVYLPPLRDFFRNAHEEDKKLVRKTIVYLQSFSHN